jgi:hypothetical protein
MTCRGNVELGVPAHAVLRRDIYVGPALAELRGADSMAAGRAREERIVERGRGELRGVVRALDGGPIDGARVALLSGEGETRTNARGEFVLAGLPFGSHTIEARAIGYVPGQSIADIVEFRKAVAEFILLDVSAYLLDTVRVAAARRLDAAAREGFERRRKSGAGQFIDESVLDTIKANTFKTWCANSRSSGSCEATRSRPAGANMSSSWEEGVSSASLSSISTERSC